MKIKWVKSEQMLPDWLTKIGVDTTFLDTELVEGRWTLVPDDRAPSTRLRALVTPSERRHSNSEQNSM